VVVSDRGVSTVLDASLAVLLIGGAVLTLAGAPTQPTDDVGSDAADGTADLLAGTTATVEYSMAPAARKADPSIVAFPAEGRSGPGFRRSAHGTVASLVAAGTIGDAGLDGEPFSHATESLASKAGSIAVSTLEDDDTRVQVQAVWRPFPEADLQGGLVAGTNPPPGADVHAATISVSSGIPAVENRSLEAASEGYVAVAEVYANATIRGLFPPQRSELALRGSYPLSALVGYRYRHAADQLGVGVASAVAQADAERANQRLASALSERFEASLRTAYRTPEAAAKAGTIGRVTVTVRTWSP
jgi:hypothetical protein